MAHAIQVTDDNFQNEVIQSGIPVIVDFWATWCGSCRQVTKHVEDLSGEYEGRAKMCTMDLDNNQQTAVQYGVRSLPTILVFNGGQLVDTLVGTVSRKHIIEKLDDLV